MTPAREAVRRLSAEGALSLSGSGRVTTPELGNDRIEELAQIRALMEPELGSRALRRAHLALIDRMDAINEANARAVNRQDPISYIRTNLEFHRTLYLRAQSPAILGLLETVWLQLGPTMRVLYTRLRRTTPPPHHRHIWKRCARAMTRLAAGHSHRCHARLKHLQGSGAAEACRCLKATGSPGSCPSSCALSKKPRAGSPPWRGRPPARRAWGGLWRCHVPSALPARGQPGNATPAGQAQATASAP